MADFRKKATKEEKQGYSAFTHLLLQIAAARQHDLFLPAKCSNTSTTGLLSHQWRQFILLDLFLPTSGGTQSTAMDFFPPVAAPNSQLFLLSRHWRR